jgi:uncharacterized protein (DUF697 family)
MPSVVKPIGTVIVGVWMRNVCSETTPPLLLCGGVVASSIRVGWCSTAV